MSEALCVALLVSGQPQAFTGNYCRGVHVACKQPSGTKYGFPSCRRLCFSPSRFLKLFSSHFPCVADLFSLTHGTLKGSVAASSATASAAPSVPQAASLSEETATLLSQELVTAHTAYRAGDYEVAYESYQQLAEHFSLHSQLQNARFFYERCWQVAKEHNWTEGQTAAHTNLGMCFVEPGIVHTLLAVT